MEFNLIIYIFSTNPAGLVNIFGIPVSIFVIEKNKEETLDKIKEMMERPFTDLSEEERSKLDKIGVNAWDLIQPVAVIAPD